MAPFQAIKTFFNTKVQTDSSSNDSTIIQHIVNFTNAKCIQANKKVKRNTYQITEETFWKYLCILLYMGLVQLPSIDGNWNKRNEKMYSCHVPMLLMSRKEFYLIRTMIHFDLNKVISYANLILRKNYYPDNIVVVDEAIVPLRDDGELTNK